MTPPTPSLLLLRGDPRSEKACWVLDHKAIPHQRRSLAPGPHLAQVRAQTGQGELPALVLGDGDPIIGAQAIALALEERSPDRPLLPRDPAERAQIITTAGQADAALAPAMDALWLEAVLTDHGFCVGFYSAALGPTRRAAYRLAWRAVRRTLQPPASAAAAAPPVIERWLGRLATLEPTEPLDLARLSMAAALGWLLPRPFGPHRHPEPLPAAAVALRERWADHPGLEVARALYEHHRGPSMADNREGRGSDVI